MLAHGIVKNHGFTDANKRTAVILVGLLYERSGYLLDSPDISGEMYEHITGLASGTVGAADSEQWFRARTVKL